VTTVSVGAVPRVDSQQDLRLLIDGIVDYGIFMLDEEGTVLTWNAGAARMLGYAPQEIIGQSFLAFSVPDDDERTAMKVALEEARRTGRFESEGWRVRKDGVRFWANEVLTTILDERGRTQGFGLVMRDLSERRIAEARYQLLVETIRDYAILTLDPNGIVQSWNAGAQAIKGY
jgi:PAS domain S-box-containing protein